LFYSGFVCVVCSVVTLTALWCRSFC